jgi:hypothetical protein
MKHLRKFNEIIDSNDVDNYFANLKDDGFIIRKYINKSNGLVTLISIFRSNGNKFILDEIIDDVKRFINIEKQYRLRVNRSHGNHMIRAADLDAYRDTYLTSFEISV